MFTKQTKLHIIMIILMMASLVLGQQRGVIWHMSDGTTPRAKTTDSLEMAFVDSITFSDCVDRDGNVYKTVEIGDQVWMAENLKVTKYRDGTPITNVTDAATWGTLTTAAYCIYDNNAANEVDTYGALYNWYAVVDSRNIAPEGWHVPTDEEWKELEMALGMSQTEADDENMRGTNEGSKLAGNADLWYSGSLENNSEFGASGFIALPGGYRTWGNGYCSTVDYLGYFWSATEYPGTNAWYRKLDYSRSDVNRNYDYKMVGFSVRCVRD